MPNLSCRSLLRGVASLSLCVAPLLLSGCPTGPVTLSVSAAGPGSVQLSPAGGSYPFGTLVTLSAEPNPGARFDHWEGDLSGSITPLTVPMLTPLAVTAVFTNQPITLSVTVLGQGTVSNTPGGGMYPIGTVVSLAAMPSPGWRFDHWEGAAYSSGTPLNLVMNQSLNIVAVFTPASQGVSLTINVSGQGGVNAVPAPPYALGDTVALTPIPNAGFHFDHWEGALTGSANPAQLTLASTNDVLAVFAPDQYALGTQVVGQGHVDSTPAGPIFGYGETVSLNPVADAGYRFDHWEGDLSGTTAPSTLVMNASKNVTAVFVPIGQGASLTVVVEGGMGTVDQSPAGPYAAGDLVTLTPRPAYGYRFDHWDGDLSGTAVPGQVNVGAQTQVRAVFVPQRFTVSVQVTGQGHVSMFPPGGVYVTAEYDYGSTITLTALPDLGWEFVSWGGALSGQQISVDVTVTGDLSISATFAKKNFQVQVQVFGGNGAPNTGGSVSLDPPGGVYPFGTVVRLTAVADLDHRFDIWYSDDLLGNDLPASLIVDGDKNVSAYFSFLNNQHFNPDRLTVAGNQLYFLAETPATGRELWTSDGTLTGTHLVRDQNPGSAFLQYRFLAALANKAYLFAYWDYAWRIFQTDGTAAGTYPVVDLAGDFPASPPIALGGLLYFVTLGTSNKIWRSDGTTAGTYPIEESTSTSNYVLYDVNGHLDFISWDIEDNTIPYRLFQSDGTPGGAELLFHSSWIGEVKGLGGLTIFTSDDGSSERRGSLYSLAEGGAPTLIRAFSSLQNGGPGDLTPSGGRLYFIPVEDGVFYSRLWQTDGVTATLSDSQAFQVSNLIDVDGALFYQGFFDVPNQASRYGLFVADSSGARLLHAINPTIGRGNSVVTSINGTLYFSAENSTGGLGLWSSNGTEIGTGMVTEINPTELLPFQNQACFIAADDAHGAQVWMNNGSPQGTAPFTCPYP